MFISPHRVRIFFPTSDDGGRQRDSGGRIPTIVGNRRPGGGSFRRPPAAGPPAIAGGGEIPATVSRIPATDCQRRWFPAIVGIWPPATGSLAIATGSRIPATATAVSGDRLPAISIKKNTFFLTIRSFEPKTSIFEV
ncbi:hypothetical protein Taro_044161 [Colocasia esculenta]|uniref:Uncharacterized protein n=1 Tax=Colocasia esculenta TaxID=4460 RepID=A0A843WTB4_COLES|nr:hypothetical protein [Colocasia esculenta]